MPVYESPNTRNYLLGRGILYAAPWDGDTPPEEVDFFDLGNVHDLTCDITESTEDAYTSKYGALLRNKSIRMTTGYVIQFDGDEFSLKNLVLCFKGTIHGRNVVFAQTALDKYYALRFVGDNPAGESQQWDWWKVKVAPRGGVALIGDQWASLGMKGEGVADNANHPECPYYRIIVDPTMTSTTTTSTTTTTTSAPGSTTTTAAPVWSENLCTGGTPSAYNVKPSIVPNLYAVANAFDGDYNTLWAGYLYTYNWIQYDFGEGVAHQVEWVTIYPFASLEGDLNIKDFTIYGSNDGINFTPLYSGQFPNEEQLLGIGFSNSTAYRYIRLYIANTWSGGTPAIREITMHKAL